MGLLVRSDYEVTLKMLRTDGEVRATGTYVSEGQPEEEDGMIKLVHLQRVHPDGKWLATLASPPLEIRLWPQKGGAHDPSREPVRIALPGVDEHIEQFRWLSDGKTLALMGNHQAWVVAARAGAKPVPVFDGRDRENNDMRVLPDGFFIRSSLEGSWPYPYEPGHEYYDEDEKEWWPEEQGRFWRQHVFRVPVKNGRPGKIVDLTPEKRTVTGATVLARGRIAMALGSHLEPEEQERIWDGEGEEPPGAVVVLETGAKSSEAVETSYACGEDGWCDAFNWAPGAEHPVFVGYDTGVTVHQGPGKKPLIIDLGEDWYGESHGLWMDEKGKHVLVANMDEIAMADAKTGKVLWRWEDPETEVVRSVHFRPDGETVVAAVGNRVVELKGGKAKTLVTGAHHKNIAARIAERQKRLEDDDPDNDGDEDEWVLDEYAFVDNVIPLANGNVAYAVVSLRLIEEGYADDEAWMHEPMPDDLLD